jgi:hypothetical protein
MEITERKIIDAAIATFNDDQSASLETVAEQAGGNAPNPAPVLQRPDAFAGSL